MKKTWQPASADCTRIFKGWDEYPEEAQRCFANMCFQLGRPRLSQFKKTIAFAEAGEWDSVAVEILDSRWSKQTLNRAKRISERFLEAVSASLSNQARANLG